jgi:hypothetical protein
MIEVPVKLRSGDVVFKFRTMSIEEAIEWSSRIKARVTYREALMRAIEGLEAMPVLQRNADEYLGAVDRVAKLDIQISEITRSLSRFAEDPKPDAIEELLKTDAAAIVNCFSEFLAKAFPNQEETKKS